MLIYDVLQLRDCDDVLNIQRLHKFNKIILINHVAVLAVGNTAALLGGVRVFKDLIVLEPVAPDAVHVHFHAVGERVGSRIIYRFLRIH